MSAACGISPSNASLAEFSHGHQPVRVAPSSRVIAGVLTAILYALFALFLWQQTLWVRPDSMQTTETTALLLPDTPHKKIVPPPPPFLAHLIKPRPETIAPPTFTIAAAAPVAPALLPASAATTSPIAGGAPAGTGATGQAVSANGDNGNGATLAGCLDPVWMRAVTDRVGRFYHYPEAAAVRRATGLVMVHFIVRRDGVLDLLEIGKSSGDNALDDAAYNMVRNAQPLPAIPDRMHTDRVNGLLPIGFGTNVILNPTVGNCSGP